MILGMAVALLETAFVTRLLPRSVQKYDYNGLR
jgi:hypothetical protein